MSVEDYWDEWINHIGVNRGKCRDIDEYLRCVDFFRRVLEYKIRKELLGTYIEIIASKTTSIYKIIGFRKKGGKLRGELQFEVKKVLSGGGVSKTVSFKGFTSKYNRKKRKHEFLMRTVSYDYAKKFHSLRTEVNKSNLYLMKSEMGIYKIGKSKDISSRMKSISMQSGMNIELIFKLDSGGDYETYLHSIFKDKRGIGEWFNLTPEDIDYIKSLKWKESE